jgi:hypothetical protein
MTGRNWSEPVTIDRTHRPATKEGSDDRPARTPAAWPFSWSGIREHVGQDLVCWALQQEALPWQCSMRSSVSCNLWWSCDGIREYALSSS